MPSVDALAVLRINNAAGALLGMPRRRLHAVLG